MLTNATKNGTTTKKEKVLEGAPAIVKLQMFIGKQTGKRRKVRSKRV